MPVPGEVMFSDEWMRRNGEKIPTQYQPLCRAICRDHGLGNDHDMEMVWLTIDEYINTIYRDGYDAGCIDTHNEYD